MKKDKIFEFVLDLIYVCLGCYGILFSVIDAFELSYHKNILYVGAAAFCIAGTFILYIVPKYKLFAAVAMAVAGSGILWLVRGERVLKGVRTVSEIVHVTINVYMGKEGPKVASVTTNQTEGLLLFFIIAAAVVIYGIVCCKKAWCVTIMMGSGMLLPFLVGKEPDNIAFICMAIVIFGAAFSKMGSAGQIKTSKAGLIGITAAILAVVVGVAALEKPLKIMLDKNQSVEEKVSTFWEGTQEKFLKSSKETGGVNNGELGQIGEFEEDESTHLKVYVDEVPSGRIYLQGYTGTEYTGRKWAKEGLSFGKPSEPVYGDGIEIEVENIKANPKYNYVPYESTDTDLDENWRKTESDYVKFARKQYMDVPENIQSAFGDVVDEYVQSSEEYEIVDEVADLLAQNTSYSLSPGKTPAGKDFAEYFYFENREGYCSHYATVATLMFRMKDIPARYVVGYVAESGDFIKDEDGGYVANVTGESAHAWAEIYIEGTGWIPAETTPGYSGFVFGEDRDVQEEEGDSMVVDLPENPDEDVTVQDNENTDKPEPDDAEVESDETENGKSGNGMGDSISDDGAKEKASKRHTWIYVAAGTVIVGIVGIIFIRKRIRYKRKMRAKRESYNVKIQRMFHKMFKMLVVKKVITEDAPLDAAFIDKLCEACGEVSKEDAKQFLDIVYRANFAEKELTRSDYQFCRRMLLILEKMK